MRRLAMIIAGLVIPVAAVNAAPVFVPGDLVVSVEGNGILGASSGSYTDNQASPMTLFQYSPTGTTTAAYVGSLTLPQIASGNNYAFSAEYGSSSEGLLHLSSNGAYLTVAGYGVNASDFNSNPTAYGTQATDPTKPTALAQSSSLTGQAYTAVARVVAFIDALGSVDTSTALYNVFNGNNPRSAFSVDGSSVYVSGQGVSGDTTGGVYYATKGSTNAIAITGKDTSSGTAAQDTRDVQVVNGQLTVSVDSKSGSGNNRDFVGTLGSSSTPPTGFVNNGAGPTMLVGYGSSDGKGTVTINGNSANGVNAAGQKINLSPEEFFFANSSTLYVADSGMPKNTSGSTSSLGDGGLQKWTLVNGTWTLDYTLSSGLKLVMNNAGSGVTGLLGLTGQVNGGIVNLYATSYTIGDTDQGYLYGISDLLSSTTKPLAESFSTLAAAPADSNFKGVAFAPGTSIAAVPELATWTMMIIGFGVVGSTLRRRQRIVAIA